MIQNRLTGYEDRTTAQLRSETLNFAERASIGTRETRLLVRIVAELAARLDRLENPEDPEEPGPEPSPE